MTKSRLSGGALAILVLTLIVAASVGASAGGAVPTSAAKAPTGPPIHLGMMSPINSATLSLPDVVKAAQAGVADVNAHGGINGRPVVLDHCDDQDNPAQATVCAQQLLNTNRDVALVACVGRQDAALWPVLDATNKISFGMVLGTPDSYSNPQSYPLMGGSAPAFNIPALIAQDKSIKKVAVAYTAGSSTGQVVYDNVSAALNKFKLTPISLPVNPAATDMTPYALQLQQSGAQALLISIAPQSAAPLSAAAAARNPNMKFYINGWVMNGNAVNAFKSAGVTPVVAMSAKLDPTIPLFKQYMADMAKYASDVKDVRFELQLNSWLSVILYARIANKIHSASSPAVAKYLNKQRAFDTTLTHPLAFGAVPNPALPRWKDIWVMAGTIKNGFIVPLKPAKWRSSFHG
jgi:branched-chain amino acid transport system substrate-binding protein